MEIIIKGRKPTDPRGRVLAIEAACQAICEDLNEDAAEGTMMLLTAAVHIAMKHSKKSVKEMAPIMAECLGNAIVAADDFFTLRKV